MKKRFKKEMRVYQVKHCRRVFSSIRLFSLVLGFLIFPLIHHGEAAVPPNLQEGKCGPYYIWYQAGPDSYTSPSDYVDLYGITFDITDVVDDFDFVYFTDTLVRQRASLDRNRDGISDRHFFRINGNQLEWRPANGRVRITQRGCWGSKFNEHCGYAMIRIQPKQSFHSGSARISIGVNKKCSPTGVDCSEKYIASLEYTNCFPSQLPEFTTHKKVTSTGITADRYIIYYEVFIQNTRDEPNKTILTDTIANGTKGGTLVLDNLDINCPEEATCKIFSVTNDNIKISFIDVPANGTAAISYRMTVNRADIPAGEVSYFTNTATLSTGGSDSVTEAVTGTGGKENDEEPGRRPERPR